MPLIPLLLSNAAFGDEILVCGDCTLFLQLKVVAFAEAMPLPSDVPIRPRPSEVLELHTVSRGVQHRPSLDLNSTRGPHPPHVIDATTHDVTTGERTNGIWIAVVDTDDFLGCHEHLRKDSSGAAAASSTKLRSIAAVVTRDNTKLNVGHGSRRDIEWTATSVVSCEEFGVLPCSWWNAFPGENRVLSGRHASQRKRSVLARRRVPV